jgi:hypothetical protein
MSVRRILGSEPTLTERLAFAAYVPEGNAFTAWREAQGAFPDHFIRAIGPFGLEGSRSYRFHVHRIGDGGFAGFVRAS